MKIKIIFFPLFLFVSGLCNAQEVGISRENKVNPLDTLDFSKIRCEYSQSIVQDTLKRNRKTKDRMLLQIGDKISKFCNYTRFLSDSTNRAQVISGASIAEILSAGMGKNRGNICYEVFKEYPNQKSTCVEELLFEKFYYEENLESPKWQLRSDTATILGYACKKAVCSFRCRNYVAWYAPEIPSSEGPWKFTGLPGLILNCG
jgi:GLPGLI family protein